MGRIVKLPESLIRLIAAGEVIERPASVMKELVENSLDAHATRISVDIWGAGRVRIRVADDGEGMTREDAEQALERHATSKLKSFDDLYTLNTFGFRGEALPSIAAVSRLEVTTKNDTETEGCRLQLEGGKRIAFQAAGVPRGTTIDVRDLFFNTPARAKFLKRDTTERNAILKTFEEIALAHPEIAFDLSFEGKSVLTLSPTDDGRQRIAELWGKAVGDLLIPLKEDVGPCTLRGWMIQAGQHQPTRAYQTIFVNGRPIQHRGLSYMLYEAYREWLPVGRHPAFALFITIDSKSVDVNVHPAKREVRFAEERALQDAVYHAVRRLFKADQPPVSPSAFSTPARAFEQQPAAIERLMATLTQSPIVSDGAAAQSFLFPPAPALSPAGALNLRFLGQFQKLYLLFDEGETLLIVDQHAAAERVHYERLLNAATHGEVARQPMLTPFVWEVSVSRAETIRSWIPEFERLGFGLEPFGANALALKETPADLPTIKQAKRFLDECAEALENERSADRTKIRHEIAARAACRAAIMAGDPVSPTEAAQLLKDLAACERPMTCPHGRPSQIRMPLVDLNKRFGRS